MPTASNVIVDHLVDRLNAVRLFRDPWPHCYFTDALPTDTVREALQGFDEAELATVQETQRTKSYRMQTRRLDLRASMTPADSHWASLVSALNTSSYRDAVSRVSGVDLSTATLTVDLWRYAAGDWLAPHVDKPEKVVTQLFYFSRNWKQGDGGRLLILNRATSSQPDFAYDPISGASALLVRSDSSWHSVERMQADNASRSSVAVTFWSRPNA